ncbi:MAG: 2-methylaconitate cis-trans isomerase PrpF family protein [Peptococcales bacterium]|jgi:2-methylaconitate cis-trans-isomerase PrpF
MRNESMVIRCSIVRGGTSKAIFIMKNELPSDEKERDKVILALFGSPSLRQLDGLGGADPTTSKVAIISPPSRDDADIDYTFGQVSMDKAFIDYGGNCGNISSGVGPFAIHYGLVKAVEPITTVRIHMTNTGHIITARVPVENGKPCVDGDCKIGGVPGTAAPIEMDWSEALGCTTGNILPTGNPKDEVEMDGRTYSVSVVDGGNTVIHVKAEDFGKTGIETPSELNEDKEFSYKVEKLRGIVCKKLGLVERWEDAREELPYQPFLALITKPISYETYTGEHIDKNDLDIIARIWIMQQIVKAYPGTATVSTGCAARIKGTLVYEIISGETKKKEYLNIGHPTGTIKVYSVVDDSNSILPVFKRLSFVRTARVLMDGYAYVRKSDIKRL